MVKRLQEGKENKNANNADKRAEREKKKFEAAVKKEVEAVLKRKADGLPDPGEQSTISNPKKRKTKAVKMVRDHTKLGHLST